MQRFADPPAETSRWPKLIPRNVYYGVNWVLGGAGFATSVFWFVTDGGVYRPIADGTGSSKLGFMISWLALLCAQLLVTWPLRAISKVESVDEGLRRISVR
jgi:hypothetical protein